MPRDLSGNMTLVTGNPVTTGTAISSTVMNSTMTDLAAEIQDSLSRSGKGGMTAAFKNADGTEAAPGLTFTNESSTGWYRSAAGVIRMSILGAWKFWYNAAGMIIKGALGLMDPAGTNKTVTLAPPTGLAADYTLTMPTALPASTLPVSVTSAGVMTIAALTNGGQNFGTPSATTDVAIKSFVTGTADTPTAGANVSLPSLLVKKDPTGLVSMNGKLLFGATTFNASVTFLTLSAGFRPATVHKFITPFYNTSGFAGLGFMVINTDGTVQFELCFRIFAGTPTSLLPTGNLDYIYLNTSFYV